MNRNALKIPAILMCVTFVILLCCACGSRDQSGYEEREISLPEGCDNIWDFNVADDGVMRIAVTEEETQKGYVWESRNRGESWERSWCYTDAMHITEPEKVDCSLSLSSKGNAVCTVSDRSLDELECMDTRCFYMDSQGNAKELSNVMPRSEVSEALYIGDGFSDCSRIIDSENLLISNESGETYLLNKGTNEITDCLLNSKNPLYSPGAFMVEGDQIYLLGVGDVIQYNSKEHAVEKKNDKTLELVKKAYVNSDKLAVLTAHKGDFYFFNEDGLKRFSDGKKQTFISKKEMSFVPSEVYGSTIAFDQKDQVYLAINREGDSPQMFCYKQVSNKSQKEKKRLEVYTLQQDEDVQKLVDHYQKENPGVQVDVTVGIEENGSKTLDDAIKKLNAGMMGGDGPDILFLDGLNVDAYVENHMLMRLDEDIEELHTESNFENIIDTYEWNGELYAVPVRFGLPIILSPHDDIVNAKTGTVFVNKMGEHQIEIGEYDFANDVRFYYQTFVDDKADHGTIDRKDVQEFLKNVKRMYDLEESQDNVHLSQLMLPPQQTGGMIGSLLGSSSLELDYIWQPQEVQMVQQLKDSTYGIVTSNQGTYYIPRMIVGISAATKQENECREFVSYLLSRQGQKITGEAMGLSIDESVLEDTLQKLKPDQAEIADENASRTLRLQELPEGVVSDFLQSVGNADRATNNNGTIMSIFMKYTEKYLNKEISYEKAVKEISDRLRLYAYE